MNISLRPWTADDVSFLAEFANNRAIFDNMTDAFPHPYTLENAENFVQFANSGTPPRILAILCDGSPAGGIGLHPQSDIQRKNTELGYWVAEPFWGKGIATRAVKLMLDYAFKNFDCDRIFARPFGSNPASQRVLEKAGFKQEAVIKNGFYKNDKFVDEHIYSIWRNA